MLKIQGQQQRAFCDGVSRRDFIKAGGLTVGGLTLAQVLAAREAGAKEAHAAGRPSSAHKAVIMVYLPGGPTHMDTYDLKPEAAAEFRGELKPIKTNVPGMEISELFPKQATIADKLAVLRGVRFVDEHDAHLLTTGFPQKVRRPAFGSVVSKFRAGSETMPPYVSLMNRPSDEDPEYCGAQHRPFVPSGQGLSNLSLVSGVNNTRLEDRKQLLAAFDGIRRDMDSRGAMTGMDSFTTRALDMVTSPKARDAFDVSKESDKMQERYGKDNKGFLQARRLVESGVSVVTLSTGGWDTHSNNFDSMRKQLPRIDQGVHALVTDLHERGLDKDVAVIMWGEFGRTPRVNSSAGRDHWSPAGFALMAGGGMRMGQVIGATDSRGERALGNPITPSNILSTLYRGMGIDPAAHIMDNNGRPVHVLDDREPVSALL